MSTQPKLGSLITSEAFRDAVHIAIVPVTSDQQLTPGDDVYLVPGCVDKVRALDEECNSIGIVDPFLNAPIEPGQKFYVLLHPQTITSLRHEWTHPAFPTNQKVASEKYLQHMADRLGFSVEEMVNAAVHHNGCFGSDIDENVEIKSEFWEHVKIVTGKEPPQHKPESFSCSC